MSAAADRARTNRRFDPTLAITLACVALLGAKIVAAWTLRVNSDEPQHLHIVWCWLQGLLPFRDVFDNHAPLFHLLCAPLLGLFGERADIVPWMRVLVIPWYAVTLWLTWRLATRLFDSRTGLLAAALVALQPTFFVLSTEFRPDDAWAAAWVAALVVATGGPATSRRAFQCGLLAGLAAAFSIKSAILIAAALLGASVVYLAHLLRGNAPSWRATLRVGAAVAAGGAIVPTAIAAAYAAIGATGAIVYCLVLYNTAAGLGRWSHPGWNTWAFPVLLPLLAWAVYLFYENTTNRPRYALRSWVLVSGLLYLGLRGTYQPLLDRQDVLPVIPMLAPFAAALLMSFGKRAATRRAFIVGVLALEAALCVHAVRPWRDEARQYTEELRTLLRLSAAQDFVMDDKAESIFRPRPVYWILENVTLYRLRQGLIPDDIVPALIASRVAVGVFDREPDRDRAFVRDNYVAVTPQVAVAGKWFGFVTAGQPIDFDIAVERPYALVARDGETPATLDGTPYAGPRELKRGPHRLIPERTGEWCLEWDRAVAQGFSPFALREPEIPFQSADVTVAQ